MYTKDLGQSKLHNEILSQKGIRKTEKRKKFVMQNPRPKHFNS